MSLEFYFAIAFMIVGALASGAVLLKLSSSADQANARSLALYERRYLWQSKTSLGSPTKVPSK